MEPAAAAASEKHRPHPLPEQTPALLTRAMLEQPGPEQRLDGCALVLRSEAAVDRTGHTYLSLVLRGADGRPIDARWWRYPYPPERRPQVGQVCWFAGLPDRYGGEVQLRILEGKPAADIDITRFARTTRRSREELETELAELLATLDDAMHALVQSVLSGEVGERFRTWPAAQLRHGAVRQGLFAHSVRVARIALAIARAYGEPGLAYDAALVTAACLLHDIGKVYTLPSVAGAALPDRAQLYDHVTMGIVLIHEATRRCDPPLAPRRAEALFHAVLAHHGRKEWGAPVEPATLEAWLVHLADFTEARLWDWADEEMSS